VDDRSGSLTSPGAGADAPRTVGPVSAPGRTPAAPWRLARPPRGAALRQSLTPARLLVLSFLGLIALGTVGFMVLPGLYIGEPLSWVDALFTATSAVCVTGLIVVDTATYFTTAGQAYILLLIQLGGLGILTFTTLLILALGRRLSLRHEAVTTTATDIAPEVDFRHLVRNVVRFTLAFEAVGALLLFIAWLPRFDPTTAAWNAVFQAVSAFCNAGFSTFSDSMMGFQGSPVTLLCICGLVVLGGLGFLTIEELHLWWKRTRRGAAFRLSLHSRLALTVTTTVLVGGWVGYAALEWTNTLAQMPVWQRVLDALFISVTTRTAGFNVIDHSIAADSTNFLTILLMSIGGSPGSTAGGLKTTTVAVIGLLAWARLRGRTVTSVWGRTIPGETVQRAVGLFVVGFGMVTAAILLYAMIHVQPVDAPAPSHFLRYMFEAASAFNTVGLSMGATGELETPGKLLTVFLMYVGRVGPLTFASAIALRRELKDEFRYAYEDVIIG
jgi:trk system potassium uptake protein TrkH